MLLSPSRGTENDVLLWRGLLRRRGEARSAREPDSNEPDDDERKDHGCNAIQMHASEDLRDADEHREIANNLDESGGSPLPLAKEPSPPEIRRRVKRRNRGEEEDQSLEVPNHGQNASVVPRSVGAARSPSRPNEERKTSGCLTRSPYDRGNVSEAVRGANVGPRVLPFWSGRLSEGHQMPATTHSAVSEERRRRSMGLPGRIAPRLPEAPRGRFDGLPEVTHRSKTPCVFTDSTPCAPSR
jgi:hypothetical protein